MSYETESIKRNAGLSKQSSGLRAVNLTWRAISSSRARLRDYRELRRQVSELKLATARSRDLGDTFDEVQRFEVFRSDQRRK